VYQSFASLLIDRGRETLYNWLEQHRTFASIRFSLDPDANVNSVRKQQEAKHPSGRTSTEAGMQIESIDKQSENALASMRFKLEPD
jgi:hypothetical protein